MTALVDVLTVIIIVLSAFTALGIACAVWFAMLRPRIDPYARPFGDAPGFTPEQLRAATRLPAQDPANPLKQSFFARNLNSGGTALPSDAGGGYRFFPSTIAAARTFFRGGRHVRTS